MPLIIVSHKIYKSSGPHGLEKKIFFIFSYCMTMRDDDPRDVANLDPRGMIVSMYVEYHLTLLHTKYIQALGLVVLEKKVFECFPIISLWQIMTPPGRDQFGPQGHDWQEL